MRTRRNRLGLVLGGVGVSGLVCFFVLMLSCSQGEDFKYVRIERDETPAASTKEKADLAVVFTGSTKGEFEPCGCGGVFEGGFARRSTVLQTIRRGNPNILVLDTGDTTGSGSEAQTEFIFEAYHLLKYDAIALGEMELKGGMDVFNKYAKKYELPFVCSNLKFKAPAAVREVVSLQRAGKRLAVISVISDRRLAVLPMKVRDEFTYETPRATLRRLIPVLQKDYDGIILLSHLGGGVREMISSDIQGVDLWIDNGGHQGVGGFSPGGSSVGTDSKSIKDAHFFVTRTPPMFVSWQNDRKVGVAGIKWAGRRIDVPIMDMVPLAKGMVEDKQFLDIYDTFKYVSRQEMIRRLLNPAQASGTTQPAFGFVDSSKCGTCHAEIYEFWKTTKHARAFATLKKGNRDADMNCWACHTVGFREEGGFSDPVRTPALVDVGCQDCHRKDLTSHPKAPEAKVQAAGDVAGATPQFKTIGESLTQDWHCRRCHVPHRSPGYEYKSYLKRISCSEGLKKDNGASEAEENKQ